jgi:CHAT domain-containing protein
LFFKTNSASFYMTQKLFQTTKKTVLGIVPVFENSNLELSYSVDEMKAIQKNFKGKYLSKEQATFANFKLNAANYSILHLSTHASSGDIESPADIKFYDQDILYSELYNLDINPDLVVLSACETGLGKLYKSEGAMSISRGFQMAGAQNLLFSLWKVNDYTTSVFMAKFYKNIKNGKSFFEANHKAKLDFLSDSSIPNAKKSPYYWAPMVYYGTIEKESSTNYFLWISIILGLITLFLIFKIALKRRTKNY